jgi:hypothetical protein
MIYVHSLGRASRYYPERKALALAGKCLSFRDLEHRVAQVAGAARCIRIGRQPPPMGIDDRPADR